MLDSIIYSERGWSPDAPLMCEAVKTLISQHKNAEGFFSSTVEGLNVNDRRSLQNMSSVKVSVCEYRENIAVLYACK
jgi:hypothetical protein